MKVEKIVRRALLKINATAATQAIKPHDMADAIDSLNAMVRRWEANGITLGWVPVENPADDMPSPDEAEEAIIYNLAIRLAPDFGATVPPEVAGPAMEFLAELRRDQAVATPIQPILAVPNPSAAPVGEGLISPFFFAG